MKAHFLATLLSATVGLAGTALAASLSLDFQPTGGTTAAGFQAFEETNNVLPTTTHSYPAFSTTVGVTLSVANLPDGAADFRAVPRNGAAGDSFNDWIGVDTRNSGTNVTMTVTLSSLPAGQYGWLSEHHDGGTGTSNGNLGGAADLVFTDASGSTGLLANEVVMKGGNLGLPVQTYSRSFTSDGGDVVFSMIMDNGQGGGGANNDALFAYMNSLVITEIPEPSSILLASLGLLGFLLRRHRG